MTRSIYKSRRDVLYSSRPLCVCPFMLLIIIHDGVNKVTITPKMGVIGYVYVPRSRETHTCYQAFSIGSDTVYVNDLHVGLSSPRFEHQTFCKRGECSNRQCQYWWGRYLFLKCSVACISFILYICVFAIEMCLVRTIIYALKPDDDYADHWDHRD